MCYPDFPFPDEVPSYMYHTAVNEYLQNYACHYKLLDHVRFNTEVTRISPINNDGELGRFVKWCVSSVDAEGISSEVFDAVVVCNGYVSY